MAASDLTAARLRELLHYDPETGSFIRRAKIRRPVGSPAGSIDAKGYHIIGIGKAVFKAHRLAWLYVHGHWPTGMIDHINGVRNDNRLANLREADARINGQNIRGCSRNCKTGYLGVTPAASKGRFLAQIGVGKKCIHIGTFDSAEEAYAAYLRMKRLLHPGCTI